MKRLVPVFCVFMFVAIACGKEASIVPVISVPPSEAPSPTPTQTATVTYEPYVTPTPTEQPLITPTPVPTPVPTATPVPPTAAPTPFPSHSPTPATQPPDAYMRGNPGGEIKGLITYYDWPTSSNGTRTAYTNPSADPSTSMSVKQGEFLGIVFTRNGKPNPIGAGYRTDPSRTAHRTAIPISDNNPAIIQANFPTGTVWVDVFTYWGKSEVDYAFKLNVS